MIIDFRQYINQIFITNEDYHVQILDYIDSHNVLVNFVERPDIQIWSTMQNIKNGQIKNPYRKSVYNIGYYGIGKYTARKNNQKTKEYIKWSSMFVRCYDVKYHNRQPTYIGCEVASEFQNFQNFAEWFQHYKYDCIYPSSILH